MLGTHLEVQNRDLMLTAYTSQLIIKIRKYYQNVSFHQDLLVLKFMCVLGAKSLYFSHVI